MTIRLTLGLPLATLLACNAIPALAQEDGFSLNGSVRLRFEEIEGQPRAGFDSKDSLFNSRTQAFGEYRSGAFRVGAELFDSRAYGEDPATPISTNEVNALELVQAQGSVGGGNEQGSE